MELTNSEKAKIFAMYLGAMCDMRLGGCPVRPYVVELVEEGQTDTHLLLKSLEDITDEDAIELAKSMMMGNYPRRAYKVRRSSLYIDICTLGNWEIYTRIQPHNGHIFQTSGCGQNSLNTALAYQYLTSKGYAVPIYPYNKNAIELRIAINVKSQTT